MQSDGNSFYGDFVLNSFNKAYRDEDNNLDKVYISKYVRIFIMMILILYNYNIVRKCIVTQFSSTKTQFYELLVIRAVFFFKYAFSLITLKVTIIIKIPKYSLSYFWIKLLSRNALLKLYKTTTP